MPVNLKFHTNLHQEVQDYSLHSNNLLIEDKNKRESVGSFIKSSYAGKHVILDMFDIAENLLSDVEIISKFLTKAATKVNATILNSNFHHFGNSLDSNQKILEVYGVTGVLVLSESHISIHTWPEKNYAAVDIFMCGDCDSIKAAQIMIKLFKAKRFTQSIFYRGVN